MIGCGCLILLVLGCGGVGACIYGFLSLMKSSDPYQDGLSRAQESESVIQAIGDPIEPAFLLSGNINLRNDDGDANISFSISGPKGSGTVHVIGTKTDGVWSYSVMDFEPDDGSSRISLLKTQEEAPPDR